MKNKIHLNRDHANSNIDGCELEIMNTRPSIFLKFYLFRQLSLTWPTNLFCFSLALLCLFFHARMLLLMGISSFKKISTLFTLSISLRSLPFNSFNQDSRYSIQDCKPPIYSCFNTLALILLQIVDGLFKIAC